MTEATNDTDYDINNPGDEIVDYATAMNADVDADVPKPPIPDKWDGKTLTYTAIADFQEADSEKQFTLYESARGDWSSSTLKLKIIAVDNPNLPSELWENKQIGYVRIDSMLRDGASRYTDFIKAAGRKGELIELQREIAGMPKSQVAARNAKYLEGLEELIRQVVISADHVRFQGQWHAQYESDEVNEKTGKAKWKTAARGMRNFPESDTFLCGHLPVVDSPAGEVRANFDINIWVPRRD